jgi:hypothetical protein
VKSSNLATGLDFSLEVSFKHKMTDPFPSSMLLTERRLKCYAHVSKRQRKCNHPGSDKFDSKEDILANEKELLSKRLQGE